MTKEQKELYKEVDEILWNDWDPIGVNDMAPRDEYQSYVPVIFSLLIKNSSVEEIADKLYKIETETIGVMGNRTHCRQIATKLTEEKNKNAPQSSRRP